MPRRNRSPPAPPLLRELFTPASVAVVGASNRPGAVGTALMRNLLAAGYRGVAYPVNPSWKSVSGVRCYPDVDALPEAPELGIVIVPAARVAEVVRALGRRGTRGVIIISSGFREVGGAGVAREQTVVEVARRYRMSLVGPNCFGVLNTDPAVSLNATFSESLPPRGSIAFVSQSGALCAGILQYGISERIGFSRFVSVGNRAGVDENDLLAALANDESTRVILLYVESLADGRRFLAEAREVTPRKPILVIKSGRTPAGERAAQSHTGSLADSARDALFDALFEQSGVLRMESIGELFRAARLFSSSLRFRGPRLAILTNSGGPGIVAADAATRHGFSLSRLSARTAARIRERLSPSASIANPLDMTADATADQYSVALRGLLGEPTVDGAFVIATPTGTLTGRAAAEAILRGRGRRSKPIAACLFGLTDLSQDVGFLEAAGVPTFTFPEEGIQALSALARYAERVREPPEKPRRFPVDRGRADAALARAESLGTSVLPPTLARELLEAYGIRFPPSRLVRSAEAAVAAAEAIGYPVVLKVASPEIPHKTDVGGVALHLSDAAAVRRAWNEMQQALARRAPHARRDTFEIEPMVTGGPELLVGVQREPTFGPVLAFGLGGVYVEVLRDVTFRLAPIDEREARQWVASATAYPLLRGVRGEPPRDIAAVSEALERVSQLSVERPEVLELDLNPLVPRPRGRGVIALDARVVVRRSSRSGRRA